MTSLPFAQKNDKNLLDTYFIGIIAISFLIYAIYFNIKYLKTKKIKYKKQIANILSFDGAKTSENIIKPNTYYGNKYTYEYKVNNKIYKTNYSSKETYNVNDEIEILYNIDNPEESITKEQYNKISLKHVLANYGLSLLLIGLTILFALKPN